jgi:hypothetical protein
LHILTYVIVIFVPVLFVHRLYMNMKVAFAASSESVTLSSVVHFFSSENRSRMQPTVRHNNLTSCRDTATPGFSHLPSTSLSRTRVFSNPFNCNLQRSVFMYFAESNSGVSGVPNLYIRCECSVKMCVFVVFSVKWWCPPLWIKPR